jgi:hypothetical protein
MSRSGAAILLLFWIAANTISAQQGCSTDIGDPYSSASSIGLSWGSSVSSSDVQCAIDLWSGGCPSLYGTQFPSFDSSGAGDFTILIVYNPGRSDSGCGAFTPIMNGTDHVVGGTITLYGTRADGMDCGPSRGETIAHEFGHVLGLQDSSCPGYIMGPNFGAGSRSVQGAECSEAENNWRAAGECLDANMNGICDIVECIDDNQNDVCDDREVRDKDPNEDSCPGGPPCSSPLIVNLQRGPWNLSGPREPVDFDIDADGSPNRITWTSRGAALAFLAVDRNGDGQINDGAELFGNWTRLASGMRAPNGFEALREFDTNGDRLVSRDDARWSDILLWVDTNHDGISQPAELQSIAESEIDALETIYHWTGRQDRHGNLFGYEGLARLGTSRRPYYDVYFKTVP